jgi:hypothetical protein
VGYVDGCFVGSVVGFEVGGFEIIGCSVGASLGVVGCSVGDSVGKNGNSASRHDCDLKLKFDTTN